MPYIVQTLTFNFITIFDIRDNSFIHLCYKVVTLSETEIPVAFIFYPFYLNNPLK